MAIVTPQISVNGAHFVDTSNNQIRLYGVCLEASAGASVYQQIPGMNANFVRIAVHWSDIEPTAPSGTGTDYSTYTHSFSSSALSNLDAIVSYLNSKNINCLIDFHQAGWSAYFGGFGGIPNWYYSDSRFPGYANRATQGSAIWSFWTNDATTTSSHGSNIDLYKPFVKFMVQRYSAYANVVGYEVFNEPNPGNPPSSSSYDTVTNTMLSWQNQIVSYINSLDPARAIFVSTRGGGNGVGTADYTILGLSTSTKANPRHIVLDCHAYYTGLAPGNISGTPTSGQVGLSGSGDSWYPTKTAEYSVQENEANHNNLKKNPTTGYTGTDPYEGPYVGTFANQESLHLVYINRAQSFGIPLLMGEWGVLSNDTNRLTYQRQMFQLFDKYSVNCTRWLCAVGSGSSLNILGSSGPLDVVTNSVLVGGYPGGIGPYYASLGSASPPPPGPPPPPPPPPPPVGSGLQIGVVILENASYSSITNTSAPFLTSEAVTYQLLTQYYAVAHPSLPNYLSLTGGSEFGKGGTDSTSGLPISVNNIFKQLDSAGISWKCYAEGFSGGPGAYYERHDPAAFYTNSASSTKHVDFTGTNGLYNDITNGSLPQFFWVTPNGSNDGHDTSVNYADQWIHGLNPQSDSPSFPGLTALMNAMSSSGVLIVIFDEAAGSDTTNGGGHVFGLLVGPNYSGASDFASTCNHFGLLASIQDAFGLPRFTSTGNSSYTLDSRYTSGPTTLPLVTTVSPPPPPPPPGPPPPPPPPGGTVGNIPTTPTSNLPQFYDPTWSLTDNTTKTRGRVYCFAQANGVAYVGGNFTDVIDGNGTDLGSTYQFLIAYNVSTGRVITTWNPSPTGPLDEAGGRATGEIYDMTMSSDGTTLYVAGNFTSIAGTSIPYVAALNALSSTSDTTAATVKTAVLPNLSFSGGSAARALALDETNNRLYVGGDFTSVNAITQNGLVCLTRATSASAWAAPAGTWTTAVSLSGGTVKDITLKPDTKDKLVAVGTFTNCIASVNSSGVAQTWTYTQATTNPGCFACDSDANGVYVTGGWDAGNIMIYFNWSGSGPTDLTSTLGFKAYYSYSCNGNVQACRLATINSGTYVILCGHHGTGVASSKNVGGVSNSLTGNYGLYAVTAGTAGGALYGAFGGPPNFYSPNSSGTPLKAWAIYQDSASETVHIGGDFTAVNSNSSTSANTMRRYARFDPPVLTSPPPPPPPGGGGTTTWSFIKRGDNGGGRVNHGSVDPQNLLNAIAAGDTWGSHRTLDGGSNWAPTMWGVTPKDGSVANNYGRASAFSLRPATSGDAYFGIGFLTSETGYFGVVKAGTNKMTMADTTYNFGTNFSTSPGGNKPRPVGTMIVCDYDNTNDIEYIYSLTTNGLVRYQNDATHTAGTSPVKIAFASGAPGAAPPNYWKVLGKIDQNNYLAVTYDHDATNTAVAQKIYLVSSSNMRAASPTVTVTDVSSHAPNKVYDLVNIGGTVYAACGSNGVYTVDSTGTIWTNISGTFFSSTSAVATCVSGYANNLWVGCTDTTASHNVIAKGTFSSSWSWAWQMNASLSVNALTAEWGSGNQWWLAGAFPDINSPSWFPHAAGVVHNADGSHDYIYMWGVGGCYLSRDGGTHWGPSVCGLAGGEVSNVVASSAGVANCDNVDYKGATTSTYWLSAAKGTGVSSHTNALTRTDGAGNTYTVTLDVPSKLQVTDSSGTVTDIADDYYRGAVVSPSDLAVTGDSPPYIYIGQYGGGMLVGVPSTSSPPPPPPPPGPPPPPPPSTSTTTLLATGDLLNTTQLQDTVNAVSTIYNAGTASGLVVLGDNAYNNGSDTDFNTNFNPKWGSMLFKSGSQWMFPVTGSHDWGGWGDTGSSATTYPGITGYYDYYHTTKGVSIYDSSHAPTGSPPFAEPVSSFFRADDIVAPDGSPTNWILIRLCGVKAVTTNQDSDGLLVALASGSVQYTWLQTQLNAAKAAGKYCVIAVAHPYYSCTDHHPPETRVKPVWDLIQSTGMNGYCIVISGHHHNYQRFKPQDNNGNVTASSQGCVQFVVGVAGVASGYVATNTPANWATLPGSSSPAYSASIHGYLSLTLKNGSYDFQFINSATGTAFDSGTVTLATYGGTPPSGGIPTVSDTTPVVGEVLNCNQGTWTGSGTISYAFLWQVSTTGTSGWTTATGSGATTANYTVALADQNNYLRCQVTATNAYGSTSTTTAVTSAVGAAPTTPVNTGLPTVSPTSPFVLQVMSATNGTWSGSPTSYDYEWQSLNPSTNVISTYAGRTASTYTVQNSDTGLQIRALVRATNTNGTSAYVASAWSNPVQQVIVSPPPPPPPPPPGPPPPPPTSGGGGQLGVIPDPFDGETELVYYQGAYDADPTGLAQVLANDHVDIRLFNNAASTLPRLQSTIDNLLQSQIDGSTQSSLEEVIIGSGENWTFPTLTGISGTPTVGKISQFSNWSGIVATTAGGTAVNMVAVSSVPDMQVDISEFDYVSFVVPNTSGTNFSTFDLTQSYIQFDSSPTGDFSNLTTLSAQGFLSSGTSSELRVATFTLTSGAGSNYNPATVTGVKIVLVGLSTFTGTDTFTRTITEAISTTWGTSDDGHTWALDTNSTADYAGVNGTQAQTEIGFGSRTYKQALLVPAASDWDVSAQVQWDTAASGNTHDARLCARYLFGSNTHYAARLRMNTDGSIDLRIEKLINGTLTVFGSPVVVGTAGSWVSGQQWNVKLEVNGTTVQAKAWLVGNSEPGTWTVSTTDSAITGTGVVGMAFDTGSGHLGSVNFLTDNFSYTTLNAGAPPSGDTITIMGLRAYSTGFLPYSMGLNTIDGAVGCPVAFNVPSGRSSITFDSVTNSASNTFSHTVASAAHRYLIVQINVAGNTVTGTGVTYAGESLTLLKRQVGTNTVELWALADPPVGTANVVITLSGSAGSAFAAYNYLSTGAMSAPVVAGASGSGSAGVQIQGELGDLLISALVGASGTATFTGATSIWNDGAGDGAASVAANGTVENLTWSTPGAWDLAAVALRAEPIAPTTNLLPNLVRGNGTTTDPTPTDAIIRMYIRLGSLTVGTGGTYNICDLIQRENATSQSYIRCRLQFNQTQAQVSLYQSQVNESDVVGLAPTIIPSNTWTTLKTAGYLVFEFQLQGSAGTISIYQSNADQIIGTRLYSTSVQSLPSTFSTVRGRVGWSGMLVDRDVEFLAFDGAALAYASMVTKVFNSVTPVEGVQLSANYAADQNLFSDFTGNVTLDSNTTLSGQPTWQSSGPLVSNTFIIDNFQQAYVDFDIWIPSIQGTAIPYVAFRSPLVSAVPTAKISVQPSQWNHVHIELADVDDLQPSMPYQLYVEMAPGVASPFSFNIDNMRIVYRNVVWMARSVDNGQWFEFRDMVNEPLGALHFPTDQRGTSLQLRADAISANAWIANYTMNVKYATLGKPQYLVPPLGST